MAQIASSVCKFCLVSKPYRVSLYPRVADVSITNVNARNGIVKLDDITKVIVLKIVKDEMVAMTIYGVGITASEFFTFHL